MSARGISFHVFLYVAVCCSAASYANLKFIILLLLFSRTSGVHQRWAFRFMLFFSSTSIVLLPVSKGIIYFSICILYETVRCSPKRGTTWAKGREQRKTGTKSDISLSLFPKRFPSLDSPFPQPFFPSPLSDFDCAPQNTYVFALILCGNCDKVSAQYLCI